MSARNEMTNKINLKLSLSACGNSNTEMGSNLTKITATVQLWTKELCPLKWRSYELN